jgi:hypothetical protein
MARSQKGSMKPLTLLMDATIVTLLACAVWASIHRHDLATLSFCAAALCLAKAQKAIQ